MLIRWLLVLFLALPGMLAAQERVPVPDSLKAQVPAEPTGRLALIQARGELIVGVKNDYPPWGMVADDGTLIGLELDLAQDMADRLGVPLSTVPVTSSNRQGRVNQGIVDVVIATAGDTVDRRSQAHYVLPNYYSSGVVVYTREDSQIDSWADTRGAQLCLNQGAYYNRTLEEDYGVKGLYFTGTRESRLALLQGRCVGRAFDDTALAQDLLRQSQAADTGDSAGVRYRILDETILVTPWSIILASDEADGDLDRFVSDLVGEWHASGRILELQQKWGIPQTAYIRNKHNVWRATDDAGRAVCARDPATGEHPAACLQSNPFQSAPKVEPASWMVFLKGSTGIDLTAFADPFVQDRMLTALGLTLALSATAIVGALGVGIVLAFTHGLFSRWGLIGLILLLPQRALITVARMTPPILQLYIVYFGLGGRLNEAFSFTPTSFLIAVVILSLYAGSTNAVILSHALDDERRLHPETGLFGLIRASILRGYDGLVAACVNIVKGAGMASAIAVSELISTINRLVLEGADVTTMMNGLLVFYFLLVLCVLWLLKTARSAVVGKP